jgi:hypothetical protein
MNYLKLILISLLLGFGLVSIHAQRTKFTSDTAYLKELVVFMGFAEQKEPDLVYSQFSTMWNNGQFTSRHKESILLISNNLLKKRARANPHFTNFLKYVLSVTNSNVVASDLESWLKLIENLSGSDDFNMARLDNLVESLILFNDSAVLFQSKAAIWKHNASNYKLILQDKNQFSIHIPSATIICYARKDSSMISNTSGNFYPLANAWHGKSGIVNWERAGYSKDSVFAKMNNYRIDLNFSEYKADSVQFTNKRFLKKSLLGRIEEKILANIRPDNAIYPKFVSYDKSVDIKNVVSNIDYSGGFSMVGYKFYGTGDSHNKANLFIYKGKDVFTKVSSLAFVFDPTNIIANESRVVIYISQDSLYHSGINFNYLIKSGKIALTQTGSGLENRKFLSSYHKLEIDAKEVTYNLKDSLIVFKSPPGTTYKKAIFESTSYFSTRVYNEVAMLDNVNPLETIRKIAPSPGIGFEPIQMARHLKKSESSVINVLIRLSDMGFINYDKDAKWAYPEQKLFDYTNSNYGRKDFDVISIISEPPFGNNAELNLATNELTIKGISDFVFSNSRRVGVIPDKNSITVRKDLEISFDGRLQAGLAWLYGKDMTFDYDSFHIKLNQVDSLVLTYRSERKNKDSVFVYTPVISTIDSITGLLKIDFPTNKSGRVANPAYPILESHGNSYVFYDKATASDSAYSKDSFHLKNYPFVMDSLNVILAKNISLKTHFKSGGIFPEFDEQLLVMSDNALGFEHHMGEDGLPLYNGKGLYFNKIRLDNQGLKGDGRVKFLNTSIDAEKFDFFPDSMNAYVRQVHMDKQNVDSLGVKYPEVYSDSAYVHWKPAIDKMIIQSINQPFNLFEDKANLAGTLELDTSKLAGSGVLTLMDAQINSSNFTFFAESLKADEADFQLKPEKGQNSPFLTYNVKSDIDFEQKIGVFRSNGSNSYIDLPVNKYRCYMDYFKWQMGINQINIGTASGLDPGAFTQVTNPDSSAFANSTSANFGDTIYTNNDLAVHSRFISMHPNQDSLFFFAKSSTYDIKNYIVKAFGVKMLKVADAIVYPSTELTILPDATIKTLNNVRILANRSSNYHRFYNATTDIFGAKRYSGYGDYEYYDRNDSLQIVHFKSIAVNSSLNTIATGEIKPSDKFYLSPEFAYYGKIALKAPNKHLEFDGFSQINHLCGENLPTYWVRFTSTLNPDSIVIPIGLHPSDNDNRKLQTSIFHTTDSIGIYPAFLSTQIRPSDNPLLQAKGYITYNQRNGYYEITDSAKLNNPLLEGNFLSFNRKLCLFLAEGKMDFGVNFGLLQTSPVGLLMYNLDSYQAQMEVMLGVDFFITDAILKMMADKLNDSYSLPPVNTAGKDYLRSFRELVGYERREKLLADFALQGGFTTIPNEMNKTLFFSNVKLKWNRFQNAWQSEGKIGIGNIKSTQVNKMVDGFIEIKKLRSGDILNIYLEIDPRNWYFFSYTRGTMKTISSDNAYNNAVTNIKDKFRKPDEKISKEPYMFFPATERARDNFVDEMKKEILADKEKKNVTNFSLLFDEQTEVENDEETLENDSSKTEIVIEAEDLEMEENNKVNKQKKQNEETEKEGEETETKKAGELKTEEEEKSLILENEKKKDLKKNETNKKKSEEEEEEEEEVEYEEEEEEW